MTAKILPISGNRADGPVKFDVLDGGDGGGDDGGMEARVTKLEALAEKTGERLVAIEKDLAVIKSNYVTKEDAGKLEAKIADAKNSVIMWVVSAIFLAQILPSMLRAFKLIP